jgi:hypothetical protein
MSVRLFIPAFAMELHLRLLLVLKTGSTGFQQVVMSLPVMLAMLLDAVLVLVQLEVGFVLAIVRVLETFNWLCGIITASQLDLLALMEFMVLAPEMRFDNSSRDMAYV